MRAEIARKWGTYEGNKLGHLDLSEDTATLVVAQRGGVADGERVRALDRDFARFASVELFHTLHLGEGDKVAILKSVSCLVQSSH
jgi:hypothetical protein